MKSRARLEAFEEVAGDVAFERAHRFAFGLSLADAAVFLSL
jgi:hypothetical protein